MRRLASHCAFALGTMAWNGCVASRPFSDREPLWVDDDRMPFRPKPTKSYSGLIWDGADQMLFRPLSAAFEFDPTREARNVNALDEVPNSSWFEARAGRHRFTPEATRDGPCVGTVHDGERWSVFAGKPDGDNPGVLARLEDGRRFLLKFDSMGHPRATAADAIVSRLFHAVGYHVPCNRVVYLARRDLTIERGATYADERGDRRALTHAVIDEVVRRAELRSDGLIRASASELLRGEPLGPFRFEGVRLDDPNDVVPHQDRRELRAMRLVAAWVGHTDSREANTLDTWLGGSDGAGHVRHHILDFGDCLGSVWEPPAMGRRVGFSAYVDLPDIVVDLVTLGLVERPWEHRRFGPLGAVLGYFDLDTFDPTRWHPGYDNPAMLRMTDLDAAWMARILARLDARHVDAAVESARLEDPRLVAELVTILEGRRRRIVAAYLPRVSPLATPSFETEGRVHDAHGAVCFEDRAVTSGAFRGLVPHYTARSLGHDFATPGWRQAHVRFEASGRVCVDVRGAQAGRRMVVEVASRPVGRGVARLHIALEHGRRARILALERLPEVQPDWKGSGPLKRIMPPR